MAKDRTEYLREYHKRTYIPTGNKIGRPADLPQFDFAGIYQLKNTVNGKIYIGQAQNILKRFNDHRRNRNGHLLYRDCYLYRAIKKYGWDKFEISVLERVDDFELLNEREIFWIDKFNPEYNMKKGGDCARGWNHTEEAKRKMSETKSKMYIGENNPFFGKKHSEETKEKIKQARLGKKLSKEHRDKVLKTLKRETKPVIKVDVKTGKDIKFYNSLKEACSENNISQPSLSNALRGKTKTSAGFKWRYYEK